ncbi:ParA family protein [Lacihabitans lacunae]|uniref:ParA family protein n=1 Tax=Lacihabitans lacunae TaxID=1028214 RepID=A0ABV7Z2E5_9BACT
MKIIAVANTENKQGKTTLAINIAYFFTSQNIKTVIIDVQGNTDGLGQYEGLSRVDVVPIEYLSDIKDEYDIGIIDPPQYLHPLMSEIFKISDFILIPIVPTDINLVSFNQTIQNYLEIKKERTRLKAKIVLNIVPNNKVLVDKALEILFNTGIKIHATVIHFRSLYKNELQINKVLELVSEDRLAKEEIKSLCRELLKEINL